MSDTEKGKAALATLLHECMCVLGPDGGEMPSYGPGVLYAADAMLELQAQRDHWRREAADANELLSRLADGSLTLDDYREGLAQPAGKVRDTGKTLFGFRVVENMAMPGGEVWVGSEVDLQRRAGLQWKLPAGGE